MAIITNKINTTTAIVAISNELGVCGVASGSRIVIDPVVDERSTQVLLPSVCTITEHEESSWYDWLSIKTDGFVNTQSSISLRISSGVFRIDFKN